MAMACDSKASDWHRAAEFGGLLGAVPAQGSGFEFFGHRFGACQRRFFCQGGVLGWCDGFHAISFFGDGSPIRRLILYGAEMQFPLVY